MNEEQLKRLNYLRQKQLGFLQSAITSDPEITGYKTRESLIKVAKAQKQELENLLRKIEDEIDETEKIE